MSENSIKVINFLKEKHGKKMTCQEVANALDLSTVEVSGVFVSFVKKNLGCYEDVVVPGAVDITFLAITNEGKTADVSALSENSQKIMAYLKAAEGQNVTANDAVDSLAMDKRKFTGAFNALVKKGYAVRRSAKVEGNVVVKYFALTDAGLAWEPSDNAE